MHRRVIALDVHQAKINACAIVEHDDGRVEITRCDFGAFKRDRRALAQWALQIRRGKRGRRKRHPPATVGNPASQFITLGDTAFSA